MINNIKQLKQITAVLLSPELNYSGIRNACYELKDLFYDASGLDDSEKINITHIKTGSGVAVGPVSAAFCIIDMMRTRVFLMGLRDAIEEKLRMNPNEPVIVLYAGTGPFATLLTPLTTVFTSAQLRFVLLEINPVSISYLEKIIAAFDLSPYITGLVETDATTYIIPANHQPDILISETMMPALHTEPQVTIAANLITQCNRRPILIPEMIKVEAALLSNMAKEDYKILPLKLLLEFTAQTAVNIKKDIAALSVFSEGITVEIPQPPEHIYTNLCLLTTIRIFKEHCIRFNESSLTIPQPVLDIAAIKNWPAKFRFQYKTGASPGFVFSLE